MFQKLFTAISIMLAPVLLHAQQDSKTTQNTTLANVDYKQEGAPMPKLLFMSYNDTVAGTDRELNAKKYPKKIYTERTDSAGIYTFLSNEDFRNDANIFIMMFNPTCSHCEDVTFMLEKNIDLFTKTKVVLLANSLMSIYIPDFAHRHNIAKYPNMYIGYDSSGFINNTFLYQSLPQINIYDAGHKLLKTYSGEVPMDTLKKYITYDEGRKHKKKR